MLARVCGFLIWALVAASLVFWGLRLFVKGPATPAHALQVAESAVASGDLSRLFGQPPVAVEAVAAPPPAMAARFRLYGVMAPKTAAGASSASSGLALIAVDGKPARPYPVGASIEGDLVVQSVSLRTAAIGSRGGASVLLELPAPVPASTGVPTSFGAAAPLPAPAAPPMAIPVPPTPGMVPVPPNVLPGAGAASIPGGPRRERGVATQ